MFSDGLTTDSSEKLDFMKLVVNSYAQNKLT